MLLRYLPKGLWARALIILPVTIQFVFAFIARDWLRVLLGPAAAAGLVYLMRRRDLQDRLRVPVPWRRFMPVLQPVISFLLLGTSLFTILFSAAAVAGGYVKRSRLIALLEPWWEIQDKLAAKQRLAVGIGAPVLVGLIFSFIPGQGWDVAFLSMVTGGVVAFLVAYIPPPELRRPALKEGG